MTKKKIRYVDLCGCYEHFLHNMTEISSVKYDRQGKFAADTFTSEPTTCTNKSKRLYTAEGSPLSVHRNRSRNFIGLGLYRRWIDEAVEERNRHFL